MPTIGFSTGALFKGDFIAGIASCKALGLEAIELSALRYRELKPLTDFAVSEGLDGFRYVSVHAPTDYSADQENAVAQSLLKIVRSRGWPIVVHPDCIADFEAWGPFDDLLCIENMDKRKPVGRTAEELGVLFERFPKARLCFDIAHAQQVDTSLTEAYRILRDLGPRVCQVHISQVVTSSRHERLSDAAVNAFREIATLIPSDVPIILETPVTTDEAPREIRQVAKIFRVQSVSAR